MNLAIVVLISTAFSSIFGFLAHLNIRSQHILKSSQMKWSHDLNRIPSHQMKSILELKADRHFLAHIDARRRNAISKALKEKVSGGEISTLAVTTSRCKVIAGSFRGTWDLGPCPKVWKLGQDSHGYIYDPDKRAFFLSLWSSYEYAGKHYMLVAQTELGPRWVQESQGDLQGIHPKIGLKKGFEPRGYYGSGFPPVELLFEDSQSFLPLNESRFFYLGFVIFGALSFIASLVVIYKWVARSRSVNREWRDLVAFSRSLAELDPNQYDLPKLSLYQNQGGHSVKEVRNQMVNAISMEGTVVMVMYLM